MKKIVIKNYNKTQCVGLSLKLWLNLDDVKEIINFSRLFVSHWSTNYFVAFFFIVAVPVKNYLIRVNLVISKKKKSID